MKRFLEYLREFPVFLVELVFRVTTQSLPDTIAWEGALFFDRHVEHSVNSKQQTFEIL